MATRHRRRCRGLLLGMWFGITLSGSSGCVRNQYQYGLGGAADLSSAGALHVDKNPVAIGGEHPRLDRVERALQAPKKVVSKVLRRDGQLPQDPDGVRQQAIEFSREYLARNDLPDVYVDVRQYDPREQWARTKANERIAPIWKYTGGALNLARYTLLPNRVFGADHFDPFTNTLSINSTRPTNSLYEAAEAKQYRRHRYLGTYAVLQNAPIVPLFHHFAVASDVLTYAHVNEYSQLKQELYPTAYAGLGSVAVAEVVPLSSDSPFYTASLLSWAGRTIGGMTGSAVATQQAKGVRQPPPPASKETQDTNSHVAKPTTET